MQHTGVELISGVRSFDRYDHNLLRFANPRFQGVVKVPLGAAGGFRPYSSDYMTDNARESYCLSYANLENTYERDEVH